jgi:mannose-6-phosphate isomerase-like protein (cupin superfamily)
MQPAMLPFVLHRDESRTYFTDELCHINELSNTAGDAAVSIAEARVEAGATTRWHRLHGIVERYVILAGTGIVAVGELAPQVVSSGSVVVIPAGCRQRITNNGDAALIFLAICSPRFQPQYYEDVEG